MPAFDALTMPDATLPIGRVAYSGKFMSLANGVDGRLMRHLRHFTSPEKDVYQFGVFTGIGLRKIVKELKGAYGHVWGFDSFQGLPPDSSSETESWRHPKTGAYKDHFLQGGYSAANALGSTSLRGVMRQVRERVGGHNVTLVPGFFNESLTDDLPKKLRMRSALHVDMDADLYVSAIDALDWMFRHRLIVPSTFIRYDDWPRVNATFGPAKGTNFFGQCRAHYELSIKYDVTWKLVAKNSLQVLSIGRERCAPAICDGVASMHTLFPWAADGLPHLPMWGLPTSRNGLC